MTRHRDMMSPSSGLLYCGDGSCFDLAEALKTIFDPYGKSFSAIESIHHHIHLGEGFRACFVTEVNAASQKYLQLKTGDSVVHLLLRRIATRQPDFTLSLFEGGTLTDGTTLLSNQHNANRLSAKEAQMKIYDNPTNVDVEGALRLECVYLPGDGQGALAGGDDFGGAIEWVLKPNTTYLVRLKNDAAATNKINIEWYWYEPGGEE